MIFKCKYRYKCKLYSKDSQTCNKHSGLYGTGYASCYRDMENSLRGNK